MQLSLLHLYHYTCINPKYMSLSPYYNCQQSFYVQTYYNTCIRFLILQQYLYNNTLRNVKYLYVKKNLSKFEKKLGLPVEVYGHKTSEYKFCFVLTHKKNQPIRKLYPENCDWMILEFEYKICNLYSKVLLEYKA